MPVIDFECQIARGQIGRYLNGDALSPQALRGLEEHIAECSACKVLVAERRAALMNGGRSQMPTHAVVSVPVSGPKENPLLAALKSKVAAEEMENEAEKAAPEPVLAAPTPEAKPKPASRRSATKTATKPVFGKPLALGTMLAVVLVGMSYAAKMNQGQGILGGKASKLFGDSNTTAAEDSAPLEVKPPFLPVTPNAPVAFTAENPLVTETLAPEAAAPTPTTPIEKTDPQPTLTPISAATTTPTVDSTETVKPRRRATVRTTRAVRKRSVKATRRTPRKRVRARKVRATGGASIKVYAPDGRPVNP